MKFPPDVPAPTPTQTRIEVGCPRCGKPLADPNGLGWCSACGYCRSLEDESAKRFLEEPAPTPAAGESAANAGAPAARVLTHLPLWLWVFLLVVGQGLCLSIIADRDLPAGDSFRRALWTTVQIGIGLFLLFLAQCWVLLQIAPDDPTLTFKDAILPFRLWALALKRLPHLQGGLWVGSLGLTLTLGAILFIGGLQHWFRYLPGKNGQGDQPTPTASTSLILGED